MKNSSFIAILFMIGFFTIGCKNSKGDPAPTDIATPANPTDITSGNSTNPSSNTGGTGTANNCGNTTANVSKGDSVCFNTQILPFFVSNCATSGCHDAKTRADGYEFTSYAKIVQKGITAGNPSKSKLYTVMIKTDVDRMPPAPSQALSKVQADMIAKWITQGAKNVDCAVVVDTQNVTFSKTIMPLLSTNCLGCHKTGSISGGINLENYTNVKIYIDNKRLFGAINNLTGYSPMPPIGKLTDCQLAVVKKWIDAGAKND
ncbi:hypothetical protein [Arcicella lustrica]|uniref:Cytochrome c domain-containing protein n=1 Tax=Arcicella lustrica TaxID=2984196 RepID=A0ABU5SCV9_9BACT|nr:hypothetical protein [Arcicella sp. DC25W]MEA5425134.1 hypothetical protein [Arcicella sp. DC25W]